MSETSINEKLAPSEKEMSNLQIENNNKEEEILALEEKPAVALVRIEKTIKINREVSNHS